MTAQDAGAAATPNAPSARITRLTVHASPTTRHGRWVMLNTHDSDDEGNEMAPDRYTNPGDWRSAGLTGVVAWLSSWEPRRRPRRSTWRPVGGQRTSASVGSVM